MKKIRGLMVFITAILCLFASMSSYAAPFNIVPKAGTSLPTEIISGGSTKAFYTVTNTTASSHSGDYVKYLPPNVSQVTSDVLYPDLCGAAFTLNVDASCTLELNVSDAVEASDPDPQHHLYVCLGGCTTCCAGTFFPLNVGVIPFPANIVSISIAPLNDIIPIAGIQQFTATAHYTDGSTSDITSLVQWNSTNPGIATITAGGVSVGVAAGGTTISATYGPLSASTPLGVAIRSYVVNAGSNSISVCTVNSSNGSLSGCVVNNDASFDFPLGIILNNSANYAYIPNYSSNMVSICSVIHATGSFGQCTAVGGNGTIMNPQRAMLNPTNNFLYVANGSTSGGPTDNTISICPVSADGSTLGTCVLSTAPTSGGTGTLDNPQDITFSLNGNFIYVANVTNVSICQVSATTGAISNCTTSTGSGTFDGPFGISINLADTAIYVSNYSASPNSVSICPLINGGAALGTCTVSLGNGTFDFANTEAQLWMQSTIKIGFVPNSANNTVSICPINNDATLGTCATSTGGGTFNQPSSITLR